MAITNLSLGALGKAVGANANATTETKLAADGAGSATNSKMSEFAIDSVTGPIISDTTPNDNSSYTITINFGSAGSKFISRVATNADNCTWVETGNGYYFTLQTSHDYTAGCTMHDVSSAVACSITAKFTDGFNINATNYNTAIAETFTIQDQSAGGGRSDYRWKQNIERVGTSQLGLPIFEFEYIDLQHGQGRYRGTIAQELIKLDYAYATYLDKDNYFWVDYDKIDIKFEQC